MIRVILVRPQGPRNVGSVLRLVANFGPSELALVNPPKPSLMVHPDLEQMSHGVEDISSKVRTFASLPEALTDCTTNIGFTARGRDQRALVDWRDAKSEVIERAASVEERVALVFGSEENGLSIAETDPLHTLIRMPTSDEHTSINLAMTVGIVLSTLFFADAPNAQSSSSRPLPGEARTFLIERLKHVLGERTLTEPAKRDLQASVERVFSRAPLETRDGRAWHLLLRALGGKSRPQDFGLEGLPRDPKPGPRA